MFEWVLVIMLSATPLSDVTVLKQSSATACYEELARVTQKLHEGQSAVCAKVR